MRASDIGRKLLQEPGWNMNTTYTIIKKCISKGYIKREEPKFYCIPLVTKMEAAQMAFAELADLFSGGSIQELEKLLIEGKGNDRTGKGN